MLNMIKILNYRDCAIHVSVNIYAFVVHNLNFQIKKHEKENSILLIFSFKAEYFVWDV